MAKFKFHCDLWTIAVLTDSFGNIEKSIKLLPGDVFSCDISDGFEVHLWFFESSLYV